MQETIQAFVDARKIALVGASRAGGKWGNQLGKALVNKGYDVVFVHPEADEIDGRPVVGRLADLPADANSLIVAVPAPQAEQVALDCQGSPIERVWFQRGAGRGSYTEAAGAVCREAGLGLVYGVCPMMFFPGAGLHRVHYHIRKWLGGLPPELRQRALPAPGAEGDR